MPLVCIPVSCSEYSVYCATHNNLEITSDLLEVLLKDVHVCAWKWTDALHLTIPVAILTLQCKLKPVFVLLGFIIIIILESFLYFGFLLKILFIIISLS